MSSRKNLRKRAKINYNQSELEDDAPKKNWKKEDEPDEGEVTKQPIVTPNGRMFYPCQYCSKIFPQKLTSITHMNKCPMKTKTTVLNENSGMNNNNIEQSRLHTDNDTNTNDNHTENSPVDQRNKVSNADVSIYDYNEQDDISDDKDLKENNEETLNNRQCKHCNLLFDNPLDLLRHTRDCHNFPRTILPPDEIEKYFDYPNREFCPICEKPIKTRNFRSVFIKHLLVHTTGLTHECGICKKKFRRRDHMRAHEKRHIVSV